MKLYEYQAKRIFKDAGIPVPAGRVADTPEEARRIAHEIGRRVVLKVQVPIGGRGKAGGIKLADSPQEAEAVARELIGKDIRGYRAERVLVEEAKEIRQEFYLGITLDRARQANVVIASSAGGMDVEEIAARHPDRIAKLWLEAGLGLQDFHVRQVAAQAGIDRDLWRSVSQILREVYRIFLASDATLVEINPLAVLDDGTVAALDGKMEVDDNALFRQVRLAEFKEDEGEHPLERQARQLGLAYVKLDGEVGIIGNGAGLVMTTLDMIQRQGGKAANFLDIGGGARAEVVRNALGIVLADPAVKSVLINVFGGITRCDEVARGLLEAMNGMEVRVPIVVRLVGTREEEGRKLLAATRLVTAATFQEAARRAVELSKGVPSA